MPKSVCDISFVVDLWCLKTKISTRELVARACDTIHASENESLHGLACALYQPCIDMLSLGCLINSCSCQLSLHVLSTKFHQNLKIRNPIHVDHVYFRIQLVYLAIIKSYDQLSLVYYHILPLFLNLLL